MMAARKTSSKKAKAQKPVEDIVIEGVAEEVNPADSASVKAKAKSEQKKEAPKENGQKNRSSFVMMISLVALLAGLTGAGLGGLAYLKTMQKSDPATENQKIVQLKRLPSALHHPR